MKLYQIIELLRSEQDQKDVLFSDPDLQTRNPRFHELWEGFGTRTFRSNADAAEAMFGKGPDYPYFFEVKSKFSDQLLKNLVHINFDNPKYNFYLRQELKCKLQLYFAKVFQRYGQGENMAGVLRKVLKVSEPYLFTDITLEAAAMLRNEMSYEGNIKEFERYDRLIQKFERYSKAEKEAERIFFKTKTITQKSVTNIWKNEKAILDNLEVLETLFEEYKTPTMCKYLFQYKVIALDLTKQLDTLMEYLSEVEEDMVERPELYQAIRRFEIPMEKMYHAARLRDCKAGFACYEDHLALFRKESVNYFVFHEDFFLVAMRCGHYEKALEIVNQINEDPNKENLKELYRERWNLYTQYVNFANQVPINHSLKFLNYFPEYSKDKQGHNINILVLQFLLYLQLGDYDGMMSRIESLRMYMVRQIAKSNNRRTQYFIRLLMNVYQQNFDPVQSRVQGNRILNLLRKFPENQGQFTEMEIIPYEELWEMTLSLLEKKPVAVPVEVN